MRSLLSRRISRIVLFSFLGSVAAPLVHARGSEILGEIRFQPAGKIEKLAGVWVDGLYLGYVNELKGSKKVLLMPGEHEFVMRNAGYNDFSTRVLVEPGMKRDLGFRLKKDANTPVTNTSSEMRLSVQPGRAAVFLNGGYVGHVDEFNGLGRKMLLPPGTYDVRITLPGYQPFESTITLVPRQKFELKTQLFPGSIRQAGPLIDERQPRISRNDRRN